MPPRPALRLELEESTTASEDVTEISVDEEEDTATLCESVGGVSTDEFAVAIVKEFLQHKGLRKSLEILEKEILSSSRVKTVGFAEPAEAAVMTPKFIRDSMGIKTQLHDEEGRVVSVIEQLIDQRCKIAGIKTAKVDPKEVKRQKSEVHGEVNDEGTKYIVKGGAAEFMLTDKTVTRKGELPAMRKAITDIRKGDLINNIHDLDINNSQVLGSGASGQVLKVMHKPSDVYIALKKISVTPDTANKEICRELTTLYTRGKAQSSHGVEDQDGPGAGVKYIVQFYGAFYDEGHVYICLEYMDASLEDVRKLGPVKDETVIRAIAWQVVRGLHYLHKVRHIVHRDIKAANLLFNTSGKVKITDFGVSSEEKLMSMMNFETFTGTMIYMSPERLKGSPYSYNCDVWSLGLALISLFDGRHMFHNKHLFQIIECSKNNVHLDHLPKGMSNDMRDFLSGCLQNDPMYRLSSSEALEHPWFQGVTAEASERIVQGWTSHLPSTLIKKRTEDKLGGDDYHSLDILIKT